MFPIVAILAVIAIYLFNRYNNVLRDRQMERNEHLDEVRRQYLDKLIQSKKDQAPPTPTEPPTPPTPPPPPNP